MADALAISLHASGAESTSAAGTAVDIAAKRTCVELTLDITAFAGTFTNTQGLLVHVETSQTGTGAWKSIGNFGLLKAELTKTLVFSGARRYVRARWDVLGSAPSFTFEVTGDAHVLYADPSDLPRTSINQQAIQNIDASVLADCCLRATADAETALNSSYTMPIEQWGKDLRGHVADRAMFYAINSRGFEPDSPADQLIVMSGGFTTVDGRKSGAEMYFDAIASGKRKPVKVVDQTPEVYEASGFVISDAQR